MSQQPEGREDKALELGGEWEGGGGGGLGN